MLTTNNNLKKNIVIVISLTKYLFKIIFFIIFLNNYNFLMVYGVKVKSSSSSTATTTDAAERASAVIPGDFVIGFLFSVHHQPKQKKSGANHFLACGEVREFYGIQRSEVTFRTIDEINGNPNILPNITLGVEIRDSCWYAPVALQQSIELIRDSISPKPTYSDSCIPLYENEQTTTNKIEGHKSKEDKQQLGGNLIGVIGPGSSSVALQVQNLLQLFSIPQIGYSTTSKDLSDKARYSTFMRVVPSDYYQAQVMVDVVRRFNWTYISAVNTDENYGQSGIQAFRELAEKSGVCIAREDSILSNADEESFADVLRNLQQDTNANVVVCFCEGMTVRGLLAAMQRLNLTDRFLIIGSDGWADRADVVRDYERQALGSISIRIHSPYVESFDPYYFALNPYTNFRNPWFHEFWESKFSCKMPNNELTEEDNITTVFKPHKTCTGNEKLSERYKQEPKLSFVVKAIYTMAYALHALQQDSCGRNFIGVCSAMFPFNGTRFLNYLMNVSFTYGPDGDVVEFDNRGDPPGRYDIMNYQILDDGNMDYVQVGEWNNGSLNFFRELQDFPTATGPVESVCSKPCPPGTYKNLQTGGQEKRCCWVCVPCERHQYLYNETFCQDCRLGYWPDPYQSLCLQIPVEHVQWHDTEALVAISFAILGFIATGFVFIVFIRYNDTPVVKSSTRELCYLILFGMILSHASVFPILARPSEFSCKVSRMLPGISFSMIYASLLVKTNRIARILAGSKKRFPTRKPRFMSASAQLVITNLLISVEAAVAITMLILEPPEAELQYPTRARAVLACNSTPRGVLAPLAFIFLLIGFCTLYAIKTRNVPENFNEAKFVGFAIYTTCVIWIAFVPIYFGSESKIITMCLCISLSAMVTLVFLFFPKVYIMLIRPEKNIRALFTTSKTIRCHIGSRVASAISHKTSSSFSSGPGPPEDYERDTITDRSYPHSKNKDVIHRTNISSVDRKPSFRSSSCQTSLELLQALFNIHPMNTIQPLKSSLDIVPQIGWAQLDVNNLTDTKSLPKLNTGHTYVTSDYMAERKYYTLGDSNSTGVQSTCFTGPYDLYKDDESKNNNNNNKKEIINTIYTPQNDNEIITYDNNSQLQLQQITPPIQLTPIISSYKQTTNDKNLIYKPYKQNHYNNNNNNNNTSSNCMRTINTSKNIIPSTAEQCVHCNLTNSIISDNSNNKSYLTNNNYRYNNNKIINNQAYDNYMLYDLQHINNNIDNIDNDNNYVNCKSNELLKATISEESLSECSINESIDCKLKSITIKLVNPCLHKVD